MSTSRRPIGLPVTIAVIMIVLLVMLIVGWVLLAVWGAYNDEDSAILYWTILPIGAIFLATVLGGVIFYMVLSIKSINLNIRQANFIDSVTHELKSPIASLKLYLQTLNRLKVSEAEAVEFYGTMLKDVERLDHLINHLLEAGRLDRSRDEAEAEEIRLDKLLIGCADASLLLYRAPREMIQLHLQPCVMHSYQGDLDIIFRNLIDNAMKYSGANALIEIHLRLDANQKAVVEVSDNGPGIPKGMRRKIFGRFVRLGLELQREKPGTGLGLYIVRTLVRRLRGSVKVTDGRQGQGTRFIVTLPGARPLNENPQSEEQNAA
ncbi:HAMP domain-containing histidine kinase [Blastopirellula sp. J2-11]|uniref:sensor histidine kinase n=1 Tax=Blastopirellula sp. J2-11 TaxID=2943192 RepID=UPI0021C82989|nr:HAMP domain-containing sensor histidine kinase [Blastopirellula sp. J2-11]UUO09007.1 HAMP domain-containing histidine kinase [Blastopirellula sp. J2-11]